MRPAFYVAGKIEPVVTEWMSLAAETLNFKTLSKKMYYMLISHIMVNIALIINFVTLFYISVTPMQYFINTLYDVYRVLTF